MKGKRLWEIGGFIAGGILILFGAVAIYMGVDGRNTVRDSLKDEQVFFSEAADEDAAVDKYAREWYGEQVTTGDQARGVRADHARARSSSGTEGLTYAQMGRFIAADDPESAAGTSDEEAALKDEEGNPVSNPARRHVGDGGRDHDGAQHELHGRAALDLRDGRRSRAAPDRHRARDPRLRRLRPRAGDGDAERTMPPRSRQQADPGVREARITRAPTSRSASREGGSAALSAFEASPVGNSPNRGSASGPMLLPERVRHDRDNRKEDSMKVEDIMTRDVLTVEPDTPIREVARILAENHISGLPVCDARGGVLGVVSEGDILYKEYDPIPARTSRLFSLLSDSGATKASSKAQAVTAGEAMTSPPITLPAYGSVAEAARLMSEHRVNRLPVLGAQKLVGIVTRSDLLQAFVREDDDIRREIEEDVLRRNLLARGPRSRGRRCRAWRRSRHRRGRDTKRGPSARTARGASAGRRLGSVRAELDDRRHDPQGEQEAAVDSIAPVQVVTDGSPTTRTSHGARETTSALTDPSVGPTAFRRPTTRRSAPAARAASTTFCAGSPQGSRYRALIWRPSRSSRARSTVRPSSSSARTCTTVRLKPYPMKSTAASSARWDVREPS